MAARRRSHVRPRRRPRQLMVEGLERRQLLAANVAVANDTGPLSTPLVRLVNAETGAERASVMAFESTFKGGVRVAMGHVTGNPATDIVVGCGSGRVAEVRVFRPVTSGGTVTLTQVLAFNPFGTSYRGGIELAVGDVDGNGVEEIITSKSRDGGDVQVFRLTNSGTTATPYATIAKPFGAAYLGGSTVGVADVGRFVNGALVRNIADNRVEILVGSGAGIGAQVQVYDLSRPAAPRVADTIAPALYAPFGQPFLGGVSVTSGRYAASGVANSIDDIVVSAGRGGGARTLVYDGTVSTAANTLLQSFTSYGTDQRPNAAVLAAAVDADGNGQVDRFLVTQGDPGGPAGIANVSIAGVKAADPVTSLVGPLRIAAARKVFATQTINGTVSTPSPTAGVPAGASKPMRIREIVKGSGAVARTWDKLTVQYTGMLTNGTVFDTSRQPGRTAFELTLGAGQVISGWEAGLVGMKVGGRRLLVIPPELAYGDTPRTGIPAKSTLLFDVELVSVTANQIATISGTLTGAVTENAATTTAGTLTVTDPDAGQAVFATPAVAALTGTYGNFTFNAGTGVWGYTLDNTRAATQALTAGQTVTDTLAVTSRDGTASRTITVTVTGANDAATIGGTATGSVTAGVGAMTAGGTLTVTDPDAGQAVFAAPAAGALTRTYGNFTFNATTGAWGYTLDTGRAATKVLTSDRTVTDSLTVTSVDGAASRQIQVSITGFAMQTIAATVPNPSPSASKTPGSPSSLKYRVITAGSGAGATTGQLLTVNYTGMLSDGTVFDSSLLPGRTPFQFTLGVSNVISGWHQGLAGMQVGEKRILEIPPELGYGDGGSPPDIPPGATLTFEISLLSAT